MRMTPWIMGQLRAVNEGVNVAAREVEEAEWAAQGKALVVERGGQVRLVWTEINHVYASTLH
jgi:phenylpyruvate tautomerase PptA (4-oxalocrotonate tautomerase family)